MSYFIQKQVHLIAAVMFFAGIGSALSAQTAQTPPATDLEAELSLGEAPQVEIGAPYTAEEIGAWQMRCVRTAEGTDPCQMYQLMRDEAGAPVAEFSLFRLPEGGRAVAGATIVVPLETSLPAKLKISVDGGDVREYPYSFCNTVGCYARVGFMNTEVEAFKQGAAATLTIVPAMAPDQRVNLELSLKGFTASFDKVSVLER